MRRRVVKYFRIGLMANPRFSVDERQPRRWWERERWRTVMTFPTLDEAVRYLRNLEDSESSCRDAELGEQLQILFESDGVTWLK